MKIQSTAEHRDALKPNGPLRTFAEVAEDLGIDQQRLRRNMGASKITPPRAWQRYTAGAASGQRTYYELFAMREWWQAHQSERTEN